MKVGDKLLCKKRREFNDLSIGKIYIVNNITIEHDNSEIEHYYKVEISNNSKTTFAYKIPKKYKEFYHNIEDYFYSENEIRKLKLYRINESL